MTMPKIDETIFHRDTPTLKAILLHAKLFLYQKRAIKYEIDRRTRANKIFHNHKTAGEHY